MRVRVDARLPRACSSADMPWVEYDATPGPILTARVLNSSVGTVSKRATGVGASFPKNTLLDVGTLFVVEYRIRALKI